MSCGTIEIEHETIEKVRKEGEAKHGTDVFNVLAHVGTFWMQWEGETCQYCDLNQYEDGTFNEKHKSDCVHVSAMKVLRDIEKIVDGKVPIL